MDIPPSAAAAIHTRACCMRAPGSPTLCGTFARSKGVRGAGRASNTAAGSSPRDGRRAMGPMSLLRTTAATHRLSSADRRLPGLGTLRRVPTADMRAHTPQSLVLPAGRCTCAARASASRCSAPGHPALWPLGAMRIVRTAMSHVCGHWGGAPDTTGRPSGSTANRMSGATRWWAVQCRMPGVSNRSRYTASEPPSSTYLAMKRAAGVSVVPLAFPPLPREHHGMGGQALHHVGCQRDHVIAELHPMVRGHQEVVPGLGVHVLQGAHATQPAGERHLRSPAARGVRLGDAALLLLTRRRP